MKAILRELLLVAVVIGAAVASFKKCCPSGEVVQIDSIEDNNLSPSKHFSCATFAPLRAKTKNKRESEKYAMTNSTSLTEMIAYNIEMNENSHWPKCGEHSVLSHSVLNESMKASQSASCVDIMNGFFSLFSCEESLETAKDFVDIHKLRKCCERNFSFDIFEKRCVNNSESSLNEDFNEFLGDKIAVFESGIPECKPDDVLVEYHSLVHKLMIHESSLVIKTLSHYGPDLINSYCVEATLNPEILPPAANHNHLQLKASSKWIAKVCRPKTICAEMPCIRKCCREGFRMVHNNDTYCEPHDKHLDINFHLFDIRESSETPDTMEPTEFGILMPRHCDKFQLDRDEDRHFFSGIDGSLFVPPMEEFHTNDNYCVDYFYFHDDLDPSVDEIKTETFVCFDDKQSANIRLKFRIYATLLAISAAFLGITFIVYIFLPKLLNLHGKTLVCHVLSLFVAYSFLSAVQFATDVRMAFCKTIAYVVFFSFLSAFSWLNVMCLDIFWTFGSIRMSHGIRRTKEVKRFVFYSLYAWGFPCIVTIFTFMIDTYRPDFIHEKIFPNIGEASCWFENSSPGHLIFFLVPVGLQISINVVLFIITAIHCNRVKSEIHRMQMNDNSEQKKRRYIADKAIFLMNLKLFIVMGISWLLEIMATLFYKRPMLWYVSDGFNLLQGVLVFFIFVFKRSVLVAFQKKLGIRSIGLRPKTPGSTSTNMSTLDLHSTSVSKHNGKMMKSNSSSTLTNSHVKN